jgi:AcrR family transcriptional regulator
MPTKFSAKEQKIIKQKLIQKGTDLFSLYGFKKTNVKDITDAAGISKGSFYNFFSSKEELLLEIFEKQEKFRNKIIENIMNSNMDAEQAIKELFHKSLRNVEQNKIFQRIYEENLVDKMLRKLSEERILENREKDLQDTIRFIRHLQKKSNLIDCEPKVLVGLFRAIFFVTLHQDEIGQDIYERVMDLLIMAIARGLTTNQE